MQAVNAAQSPLSGAFFFWTFAMSGGKIIPIIDAEIQNQRAERRADVENIFNIVEDELVELRDILDRLQQRVEELEKGLEGGESKSSA